MMHFVIAWLYLFFAKEHELRFARHWLPWLTSEQIFKLSVAVVYVFIGLDELDLISSAI